MGRRACERVSLWAAARRLPLRFGELGPGAGDLRLREGLPCSADGVPTVLISRRGALRSLEGVPAGTPPAGRAVLLGDAASVVALAAACGPAAVGAASPGGAPAEAAAWQEWPEATPSALCLCAGEGGVRAGTWTPAEERVLAVLRQRRDARSPATRLILVLPPAEADAPAKAAERRDLLRRSAFGYGFEVVDGAEPAAVAAVIAGRAWEGALGLTGLPAVVCAGEARQAAVAQAPGLLDGSAVLGEGDRRRLFDLQDDGRALAKIGRASCRERV